MARLIDSWEKFPTLLQLIESLVGKGEHRSVTFKSGKTTIRVLVVSITRMSTTGDVLKFTGTTTGDIATCNILGYIHYPSGDGWIELL